MAKTTSILCDHTLDVSSVAQLAADLSQRLQATIVYGFDHVLFINDQKALDYSLDFVEVASVEFPGSQQTYRLIDEKLGQREFLKTHRLDSDEFTVDEFLKGELFENLAEVEYVLEEFSGTEYDTCCYVSEKCVDLWFADFYGWSSFQHLFLYHVTADSLADLNQWRLSNKQWVDVFGGHYMLVYCFEVDGAEIQEWHRTKALFELVDLIGAVWKDRVVNVSNYLISGSYVDKPVYEPDYLTKAQLNAIRHRDKFQINLETAIPYPILFYDDFRDLSQPSGETRFFDFVYNGNHVVENLKERIRRGAAYKLVREKLNRPNLDAFFKLYYCSVAGFNHYAFTDLADGLKINQAVFLEREIDNSYDKHAIAIYVDFQSKPESDEMRMKIGYIGKHENYILSKLMDNGFAPIAFLSKINEKALDAAEYSHALVIEIYLKKG